MKKLLALLAVVLAVVSCQKEINGLPVDRNGEAAVSLSVALPEDATRAAGADSALGAIDNGVMDNYDVRFILEVYDMSGAAPELAKERMVQSGQSTTATFNFRLVPGRDYNFVVWADFVVKGLEKDRLYNTEDGLDEIEMYHKLWDAIDESRDAYTASVRVDNYNGTSKIGENGVITLTRPFAKLRVVTNDIKEMISIRPKTVTVKYFSTEFYAKYNALSETPYNAVEFDKELVVDLENDKYTGEKPDSTSVQTLFADYFFASQEGERVMFTMDVETNHGPAIPQVTFNTNIPVKRNNLTTVYGPILTDANNVTVTIDPAFENKDNLEDAPYYVEMISGTKTETVVLNTGNYLFDDVTIKAAGNAIEVNGDVVIDVMGVMNLESNGGIVVKNGSLVINGVVETRGAEPARAGILKVETENGSAIGGSNITIQNLAGLTAKANGNHAFGIGAEDATVVIKNTKIDYVSGGHIQPLFVIDTKYGKYEPEGGAAIGGANVTIENSEIVKAEGGSKAAAIGNKFWAGTNIVIKNSTLGDIFGGNASAAIGGSRYADDGKHNVKILIENSTITNAVGGEAGAGIGSGYDTHCNQQNYTAVNEIVIKKSNITAKGGKYSPGIGAGYHSAYLTGSIDAESTINSTAGNETFYKDTYTLAQNLGYGVMDPAREFSGANTNVTFTVAGKVISTPTLGVAEGVGVILNETEEYIISNAAGMFWFANEVNVNKNAFNGKIVKLANDIDLQNIAWTPVGQTGATTFNGVFDGQNYTISNLNVNSKAQTGENYSSGLFGWVESHTAGHGHIKNVKIAGATIVGHHNCGALVGYITQETALVENCHVTGATISCTKANNDADGDKAGALIGNATVATPVKDCTAANSTVSAGRDAGQVIGAGKEANVTGCSATNVTVSANGTSTGANVRNEVIGRLL